MEPRLRTLLEAIANGLIDVDMDDDGEMTCEQAFKNLLLEPTSTCTGSIPIFFEHWSRMPDRQ